MPLEIKALSVHGTSVTILLGFDFVLKRFIPEADSMHPAGVWMHWVLDWFAVALVLALSWTA